jgi:hypothetical protein
LAGIKALAEKKIMKAFDHAVSRLEESAQWILENHHKEEINVGAIAFDFMMLAGVVLNGGTSVMDMELELA